LYQKFVKADIDHDDLLPATYEINLGQPPNSPGILGMSAKLDESRMKTICGKLQLISTNQIFPISDLVFYTVSTTFVLPQMSIINKRDVSKREIKIYYEESGYLISTYGKAGELYHNTVIYDTVANIKNYHPLNLVAIFLN
jgi:hypothetical protein